jgi:phosphoadenosine phosphosulfate reductase
MMPVEPLVEEAIAFIRQHEPPEGYFVAFSGGKDSIVMLELVRMSGVQYTAYYAATGIDPPELCKFIRQHYPEVKWLRPKMTFWEGVYKRMPPLRLQRWCCDVLKKDPSKHIPLSHRIAGIRAEESLKRASLPRADYYKKQKQWLYKPIFHWLEWHVWDFIETHGLPYPSLYDEGFARIGCVVCPFLCRRNQRAINQHKARWPKQYKTFEHAVTRWWWKKRNSAGFRPEDYKDTTPEEYIAAWYRGFE